MSLLDRLSALYDLQIALERRAIDAGLDLLAPRPDDRLLDVGTGTGAVLRALASRSELPKECAGLDRSPSMLRRAQQDLPGCSLIEGDATRLPFPDEYFTAVTAVYLLHLLDPCDAELAAGEIGRVTRPGGRALIVAPAVPTGLLARPSRTLVGALAHLSPSALGLSPLDPRRVLERHGLCVRRARYVHHGYPSRCTLAVRAPAFQARLHA